MKLKLFGNGKNPLILIHGNSYSHQSFNSLLTNLAMQKCYTMLAIDLPGHGLNSRWSKENYDIEKIAQYLSEEIKKHLPDIKVFEILGHSLGGHIAVALSKIVPTSTLHLLQCSPENSLEKILSHFKPHQEGQILFSDSGSDAELRKLSQILFHEKMGQESFVVNYKNTDPNFRSGFAESLAHHPPSNEITHIVQNKIKTNLYICMADKFLKSDQIVNNYVGMPINTYAIPDLGHYGHYEQFSKWFEYCKSGLLC